jgi:hypothetical protein
MNWHEGVVDSLGDTIKWYRLGNQLVIENSSESITLTVLDQEQAKDMIAGLCHVYTDIYNNPWGGETE